MCTTIGFAYDRGQVFGRTLELGMVLDNKILFIPRDKEVIKTVEKKYKSKYNTIGSGFFNIASFGDGINEMGLMGSSNFFPGYASFATSAIDGMVNTTTANAFDYLLTCCKNVKEVEELAKDIILVDKMGEEESAPNHFFSWMKKVIS